MLGYRFFFVARILLDFSFCLVEGAQRRRPLPLSPCSTDYLLFEQVPQNVGCVRLMPAGFMDHFAVFWPFAARKNNLNTETRVDIYIAYASATCLTLEAKQVIFWGLYPLRWSFGACITLLLLLATAFILFGVIIFYANFFFGLLQQCLLNSSSSEKLRLKTKSISLQITFC